MDTVPPIKIGRGLDLARSQSKQINGRYVMFKTAVLLSKKSSGLRQKPAAWFHFSIFILFAISIAGFSTNVHALNVKVSFTPSQDSRVKGHNFYYCQSENISKNNFTEKKDIGSDNVYIASNLQEGATYYFAATAYDSYGNESQFSNVVSYTVSEDSF